MKNNPFKTFSSIPFEGAKSKNPLSFRHYERNAIIEDKPMHEHLRFAAAYWHCMRNPLADPFGAGTAQMPWDDGTDRLENAKNRVRVFFDFLDTVGIDYYCFHDRDIAPEGRDLQETNDNLHSVVEVFKEEQQKRGKQLLWGTACLFVHPRYVHGAGTSPNVDVFLYAANQIKNAMDATHALGGLGYTFWGGREGYGSLINTDMAREQKHMAELLRMAVDYKQKIGFDGQFYIEPKPKEPTTHQYDSDAAACLNFLREHHLLEHFKLNIETNHAQLAAHTVQHELAVAAAANALGSIDANQGNLYVGWDTDEYPTDIYMATHAMLAVLGMGGFTTGGLNFDAKRRRESFEPEDLIYGHVAGMDTFARGLKIASAIRQDGRLQEFIQKRYASWDQGIGSEIEFGKSDLATLEKQALETPEPNPTSGRQEMLENIMNQFL